MVTDEEEFKKNQVIPLLKKLGFMEVRDNHGVREFGKDILFSKYDEFGLKRYYAAQIKAGNIRGKNSREINDLINHIRNAFSVPFTDIITKNTVYIDEFYVIVSGKFIGNAKDVILNDRSIKQYSNWTHFFDGTYIAQLFIQNFQEIQKIINETIWEQKYNLKECTIMVDTFKEHSRPLHVLRKYNLERLISEGEFNEDEKESLYVLVSNIDLMNTINDALTIGSISLSKDGYEKTVSVIEEEIPGIIELLEGKLRKYFK